MSHSTSFLRPHAHVVGRFGAALLAALVFAGCSKPPEFTVKLDAPGALGDFTHYKLVVDGAPVGPFTATLPYQFSAPGHSWKRPKDMLPHVEASVLSVCGWEPAKVQMSAPSEGELERAGKEKRSVPVTMYLDFERPSFQQVTVVVDNRGGPAFRLAVGEYERTIPANDAGKEFFPYWPRCDQAKQLRMNGETIGKIEDDVHAPGTALPLLLDTSGSRCYRYESRTYSNFPSMGPGGGQRTYKPQRVRTLSSNIDFFLQPLPTVVYSTLPVEGRAALNDIACRGVR
jgi:hypothetical protein